MAQLWHSISSKAPRDWRPHALPAGGGPVELVAGFPSLSADGGEAPSGDDPGAPLLFDASAGGQPRWVILAPPDETVRINGEDAASGIRVLRDRDEIVARGSRFFFSAESLAGVVPFPGPSDPDKPTKTFCTRCKSQIEPGAPAVRCPGCGAWHHQDEGGELPCWTYAESCALCAQPTALDAGFQWTPYSL